MRFYPWSAKSLWAATIMQFAFVTTVTQSPETTARFQKPTESPSYGRYAWNSWGSWSSCSRSCGGGVAFQERQCQLRPQSMVLNSTLPTPIITVRVTRDVSSVQNCAGISRRYHECNTQPCPGRGRDKRAEQCSSYDRKPFRGRFYTWVPYIDGNAPCTLNCRPLGHHFYASLSLVADGTPCTMQGFRAICIQGACKGVGKASVLASAGAREVRCGRRLVSGLFTRPRLPLGYSYITTVPQGACRLNVSEIVPGDNYIALKITNGSYIMNGEFAVSAAGTYEAAGARFIYTRTLGLDSVFAIGPILHPVDIMILYTQPNPNIKYEYFTDAMPGEVDIESITSQPELTPKHIRRHHGLGNYSKGDIQRYPDVARISKENDNFIQENVVGSRKFVWKILSYTQCSRSCGGGFQVGKYRCVESSVNGDREVSPVHCSGSQPGGRRRRCNNIPCAPRWRVANWSPCPQCGPSTKTRIVGCVQDHSKGIIKVSEQKCLQPKPPTSESCNIPDCNSPEIRQVEPKRRTQENTDVFREGPVYTISVNSSDADFGPEYSFGVAGWLSSSWSECVGWCVGGGVQTRSVRCADPSGCAPMKSPEITRTCTPNISCESHDGYWFTGDWSTCTSKCGGRQVRGVLCIGGTGRHLKDSACRAPRPDSDKSCGEECSPTWYTSEWGQCTGNCSIGLGVQRRTVLCIPKDEQSANDSECRSKKPHDVQSCSLHCAMSKETKQSIKSQKASTDPPTTEKRISEASEFKECEDKLTNCALAVQARLCHYKYYTHNCCNSCK